MLQLDGRPCGCAERLSRELTTAINTPFELEIITVERFVGLGQRAVFNL
jgi:hypothetical protein